MNNLKTLITITLLLSLGQLSAYSPIAKSIISTQPHEYVVISSDHTLKDSAWKEVAQQLQQRHQADLLSYSSAPQELLTKLQELSPRYVAIVLKPEEINKEYVVEMHKLSRQIDDDIYADFLWGIITGYNAEAALRMVTNSSSPLTVKSGIATITELKSGKWFDAFAYLDDFEAGLYGEKLSKTDDIHTTVFAKEDVAKKFADMYTDIDPDFITTGSHATQYGLEIPYTHNKAIAARVKSQDGLLYVENSVTDEKLPLLASDKPRVYMPVANCLIGDIDNSENSMALAWMNTSNITAYAAYVVPTWYGRNGWGGLKYWLTTPGRYTVAQAMYLNQQDINTHLGDWDQFSQLSAPNKLNDRDKTGFEHDRDVVVYYGDPKWDARLQEIPEENDFTVQSELKGNKYIITIQTKANFSLERMQGSHFKEEHVQNLPFSYFFPDRLNNPRLSAGQDRVVALDQNFILVYNPQFEANKTYTISIDVD